MTPSLAGVRVDHCVYFRAQRVQCERLGEHIHARVDEISADERVF